MSGKPSLTSDPVYQKIQQYYNQNGEKINIKQLFESDPARFDKFRYFWFFLRIPSNFHILINLTFSLKLSTPNDGDILLDYSKNRVTDDVFKLLVQLAESRGLAEARAQMFSGAHINITEDRAVLHTALRNKWVDLKFFGLKIFRETLTQAFCENGKFNWKTFFWIFFKFFKFWGCIKFKFSETSFLWNVKDFKRFSFFFGKKFREKVLLKFQNFVG